jgi:hypothetical protein
MSDRLSVLEVRIRIHLHLAMTILTAHQGPKERHLETLLHNTLRSIILTRLIPRTLVQITLQVRSLPEEDATSGVNTVRLPSLCAQPQFKLTCDLDPNYPSPPPPHRPPLPPQRLNSPFHNPNFRPHRAPHIVLTTHLAHRERAASRKADKVRTRVRLLGR